MCFMGGLTGQQGAFRSMFLLKSGLDARHFIATGVILAIMVDLSRLPGYFAAFSGDDLPLGGRQALLIALATLSAFPGAWIGGRHMKKATIRSEENTSELQSLMTISYAVVCLKKN